MISYELLHKYGWTPLAATTDEEAQAEAALLSRLSTVWEPKILKIEKTVVPWKEGP